MGWALAVAVLAFEQLRAQKGVDGRLFPGGIPEVPEHLSGPDQLIAEKSAPWQTRPDFTAQFSLFLQLVKRLYLLVLFDDEPHHFRKNVVVVRFGIVRPKHLRRAQPASQISRIRNTGFLKVTAVDPGMEVMVGGVTTRVAFHPAVEIARRVQGLGGVADEMTQDAQEENGVLTRVRDFLRVAGLFEGFQVGKSRLQPGVVLRDGPWKKTNQCS